MGVLQVQTGVRARLEAESSRFIPQHPGSLAVAELIPDAGDPLETVLLEVRADHLVKAGRDLFFLSLVVAASGFVVAPEPWKQRLLLGIPLGLVLYLVALYVAARLRHRAMAQR